MTTPVMPNGFVPLLARYSQAAPDGVMRTEVAGGAARYALEWARGVQRYSVTLLLDATQFMVWSAWFHLLTNKGSLTFTMRIDSGFGPSPHDVNMVPDTYEATHESNRWIVSFIVEAESQVYQLTAEDAQALVDLYNAYGSTFGGLGDLFDRLAQFANFDTNVLSF